MYTRVGGIRTEGGRYYVLVATNGKSRECRCKGPDRRTTLSDPGYSFSKLKLLEAPLSKRIRRSAPRLACNSHFVDSISEKIASARYSGAVYSRLRTRSSRYRVRVHTYNATFRPRLNAPFSIERIWSSRRARDNIRSGSMVGLYRIRTRSRAYLRRRPLFPRISKIRRRIKTRTPLLVSKNNLQLDSLVRKANKIRIAYRVYKYRNLYVPVIIYN